MRRGVAIVSVALTTFSLVILASVIYAYRGLAASPAAIQRTSSQQPIQIQADPSTAASAPPAAPNLTLQDAGSIAAKHLNRTDLYSAEVVDYNGIQAFKIMFTSGDIVYVSATGAILADVPPAPVVIASAPHKARDGWGGGGGGGHDGGDGHDDGGSDGGGD